MINSFSFTNFPLTLFGEHVVSENGETIALQVEYTTASDKYLHIYSKIYGSDSYSKTELGPFSGLTNILVSESGDRVFYYVCHYISEDKGGQDYKFVYIEKTDEGWTKEIQVPYADHYIYYDENEVILFPKAIANNGKTIIGHTNKNMLAMIHEENGNWSEPEFVGKLGEYVPSWLKVHVSNDARVIAVPQPRYVFPDYYELITYDAMVYVKNQNGEWSKHKTNPNDAEVLYGLLLLNPNGTRLYWTPRTSLSISNALNLK